MNKIYQGIKNTFSKLKDSGFFSSTLDCGESFKFLEMKYKKSPDIELQIGDEVIIHPVKAVPLEKEYYTTGFKSQATKPYPAKIIVKEIHWTKGDYPNHKNEIQNELCLKGIRENENWYGAVLNEWGFDRLEFVCRG